MPNTLAITRSRDEEIEDILDSNHYTNVGGTKNINELESYVDENVGTIVFNNPS